MFDTQVFDTRVIVTYLPDLLQGLWVTILFTFGGLALGLAIGIAAAVLGLSRSRLLHWIVRAYVDFVRGTPLLLQLFILYYAFPALGLRLSAPTAGVLGLGVNAGAYLAEIFRAGFEGVPRAHGSGRPLARHELFPDAAADRAPSGRDPGAAAARQRDDQPGQVDVADLHHLDRGTAALRADRGSRSPSRPSRSTRWSRSSISPSTCRSRPWFAGWKAAPDRGSRTEARRTLMEVGV